MAVVSWLCRVLRGDRRRVLNPARLPLPGLPVAREVRGVPVDDLNHVPDVVERDRQLRDRTAVA